MNLFLIFCYCAVYHNYSTSCGLFFFTKFVFELCGIFSEISGLLCVRPSEVKMHKINIAILGSHELYVSNITNVVIHVDRTV